MDLLRRLIDVFLHLDAHLSQVIAQYGTWTHLILFAIVFCETGLVVTPFLPGDSLLFVVGTLAAVGGMDIALVMAVLFGLVAAAAWVGGEVFLAVMGGIGCLMTIWVGALTLFRG